VRFHLALKELEFNDHKRRSDIHDQALKES